MFKYKDDIKLVYIDNYKKRYYPIPAGFILDYKEQVCITGIKANMQYSIYHIQPKKKRINNLVMKAIDLLVNINSACMTTQQFSNSAE